jgi:hypothetical protein
LIEYARRSLEEWIQEGSEAKQPGPGIESLLLPNRACPPVRTEFFHAEDPVDALLANGYLGTAIEILEQQVSEHPRDFELAMKFAEAHGRYCRNFGRAKRIVSQIASNPAFSKEQITHAQGKLKEWRASPNEA